MKRKSHKTTGAGKHTSSSEKYNVSQKKGRMSSMAQDKSFPMQNISSLSQGKKLQEREKRLSEKNGLLTEQDTLLPKQDMPIAKGQEFSLRIEDMGTSGEGIGHKDGYTLFVKDALEGDLAQVKVLKTGKSYGYARLLEVLEPSPWRVAPVCPCARQCGGCQLQHCSYEKQLQWKEKKVRDCLQRIGGFSDIPMEPVLGMDVPFHYRNKAQYPVGYDKEGRLVAGFYAQRTHSIIPNTNCAIQHPGNAVILETVLKFMQKYHISAYQEKEHTGLVRHVLIRVGKYTGEVMVCLVINGKVLPQQDKLVKMLLSCTISGTEEAPCHIKSICFNVNTQKTNCILGDEVVPVYGQTWIEDRIGDITYRISPLSFYQVNPLQTQKLYRTALEFADLQGHETVWDLYCGIGTISLFLAQKARAVYGVEIVAQAVEDARENARRNGMENVKFFAGAAEQIVPEQYEKSDGALRADVVTLDPPRKGCEEKLLQTVVQMQPEKIIYVSCDPATLARDLKYLCGRGYALERVRACDMFGHSGHIETVCLLSQRKPDTTIDVNLDISELEVSSAETKATYEEIKSYVLKETGLKVSNLYIAQIKQECGIIERENYNLPKSEGNRVPRCPEEKRQAILQAFRHFQMI